MLVHCVNHYLKYIHVQKDKVISSCSDIIKNCIFCQKMAYFHKDPQLMGIWTLKLLEQDILELSIVSNFCKVLVFDFFKLETERRKKWQNFNYSLRQGAK